MQMSGTGLEFAAQGTSHLGLRVPRVGTGISSWRQGGQGRHRCPLLTFVRELGILLQVPGDRELPKREGAAG